MSKATTKQKGKRLTVPVNADELRRLLAQKPEGVRAEAAWIRQLAMERVAQLEQANGKGR